MTLHLAPASDATEGLAPEFLRINEAVRLFPFSRSDLYRRSQLGEITILKLGSRRVVRRTELEALVAELPRLHPHPASAAAA
jgi:hypothetical protein